MAWWEFDEGSGTSASDSTGNGNTGTLNGTTNWYSPGKIGTSAISFPGLSGSGVSLPSITTGTTFTYAAWIYIDSATNPVGFFNNLLGQAGTQGLWLNNSVNKKITYYYSGDHLSSTTLPTNTWVHIAVVNNAGAVTFYLNGSPDGTASNGPSFNANGIGADAGNGGESFGGYHDDVRLYSRALSSLDISELYALGSGDTTPPTIDTASIASSTTQTTATITWTTNENATSSVEYGTTTSYGSAPYQPRRILSDLLD